MKEAIRQRLLAEGFTVAGFAPARADPSLRLRLDAMVEAGWHGGMDWLGRRRHWRGDPRQLWHEAKSAILVGMSYAPDGDPLAALEDKTRAAISVYAQGPDYHEVMKARLKRVASQIARDWRVGVKVFVDTAPVMEKPLAAAAGLGWQGKHTNLVSRSEGSWLFLGVILTSLDLAPDHPEADHCGSCHACLDICPTKAFPAPYQLDARRCISYLTIEHEGPIPHEFRAAIGNRIYGCDDCLAVCPWNKFAAAARNLHFAAREAVRGAALADLAALDESGFRALFRGSAIKRIGRARFLRNVLIAIGNSGDRRLISSVEPHLGDASPSVRGAAVHALGRLVERAELQRYKDGAAADEKDESVRAEWRRVLGG